MTLTIPDEILKEAKLTEREALVELACRLFDAGRLSLPMASRLAGLPREHFEGELHQRRISIYRPTLEDVRGDVEALKRLGI